MSQMTPFIPDRPPRTREIEVRGLEVHVTEWGEDGSPLLVYLHGWADTGATFQFVVDSLPDAWHVVAPDLRGFGRTACDCSSYWFPDYLADLAELLDVLSPDNPAVLVGHSMGGNIASLFAGVLPERVRALVNIEGFGLPDSDPGEAPGRYRAWIEEMRGPESFQTYPDVGALAERIARRHRNMDLARATFVARLWGRERFDGKVVLRADPRHRLPNPVLYRRAEAEACWRAITAPVLLVTGAASDFAARGLGDLTTVLPQAAHVVIEGAGHMLHFERPEALAATIDAYLAAVL